MYGSKFGEYNVRFLKLLRCDRWDRPHCHCHQSFWPWHTNGRYVL